MSQVNLIDIEKAHPQIATSFTTDAGSAIPIANVLEVLGGNSIETSGAGNTITVKNLADISKYVVDSIAGETAYQTIQSAIDAATAAGIPATVFIRPGIYTEDLTLYDNIDLFGITAVSQNQGNTVTIIGTHTPPSSGHIGFNSIYFQATTAVFSSAVVGTTHIVLLNCESAVQNGYFFDLLNWTGTFEIWDHNPSAVGAPFVVEDGGINNTGGATLFMFSSGFGSSTVNTMILSGTSIIGESDISSPVEFVTGADISIAVLQFDQPVTFSNNSTGQITYGQFTGGISPAITMNSTGKIILTNGMVDSSAVNAISGAGAGILSLTGMNYIDSSGIAVTLTLDGGKTISGSARLLDRTANAVAVYSTGGEVGEVGPLTDGQLVIGSLGNSPLAANLASAGGTVAITNGAGTINLEAGAAVPTTFTTDAGNAIPALNVLNVIGGNNISTTGAVNNLTVSVTGTTTSCVQVGNASGSLTSIGAGTSGELLIGNTGADPAFGSTAYADFSFSNITAVATPRSLNVVNTDVDAASHADLRLSTPPLGGDSLVSWEVQGSHFFAAGVDNQVAGDPWKLSNSSHPSAGTAAITVDATTAAVTLASAYEFPVADGNANEILKTDGAGNLDFVAAGSLLTDLDNILFVGKHGNDANNGKTPNNAKLTIQAAVTAAAAGDTIWVYPGTYTETITHAANNVTVIAAGKPNTVIITQADANVIDFATFTGIQYKYFGISCTAATSAINTVQGSTGGCTFKQCNLAMTCATDIAAVAQPAIGEVTGAGKLIVTFGRHKFEHTGAGGATAQKGAFRVGTGGQIDLTRIEEFDIVNSGTALASTVGIDTSSTGFFKMNGCNIEITDPDATVVAGLAYLGGTGTENEFRRNTIRINVTNNIGYGFFASDTASTSRFFYNHMHITDVAGTSYSYHIGNTATVISVFDDIIADDGIQLTAGGTFTCTSSLVDGDFTCRGREPTGIVQTSILNMDNAASAGNAALNIAVGGTTSTGDPYVNWDIPAGATWSAGPDNSDADAFKIGPNADPSTGNSDFEIATGGDITFNEAYTFPTADGTASFPLVTDGAGNLDFNALTVAGGGTGVTSITDHSVLVGSGTAAITEIGPLTNGQLVIGSTGADPVAATLTDGNNITFTEGAGTITANLTGATQYAVQVGDATGSLDSLALGTANQVLTSNGAGANPSWQAAGGGGLTWTAVTVNASFTGDTGTIANKAGLLTMTLPATGVLGEIIRITGINTAVGWRIAQNANQTCHFGTSSTTTGVGGYLEATNIRDSVELVCVVAGASAEYNVISSVGNITIT